MADIFLSYSREDESRIHSLVSELEARGWSVFWDRRIPAGETWRSYIGSALQNARCVIVAWSKHSVGSQWVAEEADDGKSRGILVPIFLDSVQPPHGFREIQAADLSNWRPGQSTQGLNGLIAGLERRLGAQSETRGDGQRLDRSVGEHISPVNRAFRLRSVLVTLLILFAAGASGYLALRGFHSDKKADATPGVSAQGNWLIVTGSFARKDSSAAEQRRAAITRAGFAATVIDTNEYPLLTPDLWAVILGPFESRDKANTVLVRLRDTVPDAYVKKGR